MNFVNTDGDRTAMVVSPARSDDLNHQATGADLLLLQDKTGHIQVLRDTVGYHVNLAHANSHEVMQDVSLVATELPDSESLVPKAPVAYCEAIAAIITQAQPIQGYWYFEHQGQFRVFELTVTPLLCPGELPSQAFVMGCVANLDALKVRGLSPLVSVLMTADQTANQTVDNLLLRDPSLPSSHPDSAIAYPDILMGIARRIRQTLNLTTIGQQTVNGLGESLGLSRCWLVVKDASHEQLQVHSEFCQPGLSCHLGSWLDIDSASYWEHTLTSADPIIVTTPESQFEECSVLVIATYYQHQCNGILCLQQCDYVRQWHPEEVQLVQELAEQLGAAIAHATLYQELEQATQEAETASRLKSEFLASTSHELRTPLNGIIGFLKLVLEGMADNAEEQREFLEEAHHSALHLLNLINDILDIAKIEAGKLELEFTAVELDTLLSDVEKITRPQALNKQLSFQIESAPTLTPIMVHSNYQRLLQVMLNLVGNAIKFTHEGGICLSTEVVKKPVQLQGQTFPGSLEIRVADTGIGVSLDQQDKLFEKFVQVDGSRTKTYGGTGLGLAISQKLVEAMGGRIFFYSMGEGLGSTVTFTIPLDYLPIFESADPINPINKLERTSSL